MTALNEIEESLDINFAYSEEILSTSIQISMGFEDVPLRTVLDYLIATYFPYAEYISLNDKIIIRKRYCTENPLSSSTMTIQEKDKEIPDDSIEYSAVLSEVFSEPAVSTQKDPHTIAPSNFNRIELNIKLPVLQNHYTKTSSEKQNPGILLELLKQNSPQKNMPIESKSGNSPATLRSGSSGFRLWFEAGYGLNKEIQGGPLIHCGQGSLMLDFSLSEHFSISSGAAIRGSFLKSVIHETEAYTYDSLYYNPDDSLETRITINDTVTTATNLTRTSYFLEIPISLNYRKALNDYWHLQISSGLSNLWLLYHSNSIETAPEAEYGFKDSWLLLFQFSCGLQREITELITFKIEPRLNIPLNQRDFLMGNNTFEIRFGCIFKF